MADERASEEQIQQLEDKSVMDLSALPEEARRLLLQQMLQTHRKKPDPHGEHRFWDTQPVPKLDDPVESEGPIEASKTVADVRQEPLPLPDKFEWFVLDIDNDAQVDSLYTLLLENYVEDDDAMFRFAYRPAFLRWALKAPGWLSDWHVGVRVKSSGTLVAFISAIPVHMLLKGSDVPGVEINFLCVHKKLRSKRLAPLLIAEITRRVNLRNIWQAVYTAGILLPKPIAKCQYWHRSLNPRKLIDVNFSSVPQSLRNFRDPMAATEKLYALPAEPATPGMRKMERADVAGVVALVQNYLSQKKENGSPRFGLRAAFSAEEIEHWLFPRAGVMSSYVACNGPNGAVSELVSFYSLPSSVIDTSTGHTVLEAAYCFYNIATTVPFEMVLRDALILAKREGFDVFNALDMMDNGPLMEKLKFGIGDGALHYYLYNYRLQTLESADVGLVML